MGVSSKSCGLQGDKAGRRVCPPELRTPQLCAVLKVQMRQAHGTQDAEVLFVREHLVASALPKRVMVSDRPHLPGLPRVGVLNHPYRWLTWTVKPVSPPSSTGRPSIRSAGAAWPRCSISLSRHVDAAYEAGGRPVHGDSRDVRMASCSVLAARTLRRAYRERANGKSMTTLILPGSASGPLY